MKNAVLVALALAICAVPALAQETAGDSTMTETPAVVPAPRPQPVSEGWLKTSSDWIKSSIGGETPKSGFYVTFDGLPPGSGIGAGPGFRQQLFGGRAAIDAAAAVSWSRSTFAQATFELPQLAHGRISVGTQVTRQDFRRLGFFGIGPASIEADGTTYAFENTDYLAFASVKPMKRLTIGSRLGYSQPVNIERPRLVSSPATQDLFTSVTAPGLAQHPAFLHSDMYVDLDTRNHPNRPTSGGDYRITLSTFRDQDFGKYSFRRLETEASRFIPILHENWIIALRGRVVRSDTADGNVVPFYLLPTLGGSRSLRGYDDYRFSDRNLPLVNAEYRWRVFGALDGALFYDAGKVTPRFGDLDLTRLT